jgi:hypothetical protein
VQEAAIHRYYAGQQQQQQEQHSPPQPSSNVQVMQQPPWGGSAAVNGANSTFGLCSGGQSMLQALVAEALAGWCMQVLLSVVQRLGRYQLGQFNCKLQCGRVGAKNVIAKTS